MKVVESGGKRRKGNGPEQIVRKLRDADAMLNAGNDGIRNPRIRKQNQR
jgi:hypothetical protein